MTRLMNLLKARHEIVQSRIDVEQTGLRPDSLRIAALKKIKLGIRDQIAKLERLGKDGRMQTASSRSASSF